MGCTCARVVTKDDKLLLKPLNSHMFFNSINSASLTQIIDSISLLRARMLLQFNKLILASGTSSFKVPTLSLVFKAILVKISAEVKGNIKEIQINYSDEPPYIDILNKFQDDTQKLIEILFDFIIEIRGYKASITQIEKDLPLLVYIQFENKIENEQRNMITSALDVFQEIKKLRNKMLTVYKAEVYCFMTSKQIYISTLTKIGEYAYKNNINDINKIVRLIKLFPFDDKIVYDNMEMYNSEEEGISIITSNIKMYQDNYNALNSININNNTINN